MVIFEFSSRKNGAAFGDFVCFTLPLLLVMLVFVASVHPFNSVSSKVAYLVCLPALVSLFSMSLISNLGSEHYSFSRDGVTVTRKLSMWTRRFHVPRHEVSCCASEDLGRSMFGGTKCHFVIHLTGHSKLKVRAIFHQHEVGVMVRSANSALGSP